MNKIFVFLSVAFLFSLAACKSSQKGKEAVSTHSTKELRARFSEVIATPVPYHTLTLKTTFSVTLGGKELSSGGTISIISDELIRLTVQPLLGIELFRVEVTKDSLFAIDRLKKRYVAESLAVCQEQLPFPVNLYTLEALLTGRLFLPGDNALTQSDYRKFSVEETARQELLFTPKNDRVLSMQFQVNNENELLQTSLSLPKRRASLEWTYEGYTREKSGVFPKKQTISAANASRSKVIGGSLTVGKIEWNKSIKESSAIPRNYERISVEALLNLLKR